MSYHPPPHLQQATLCHTTPHPWGVLYQSTAMQWKVELNAALSLAASKEVVVEELRASLETQAPPCVHRSWPRWRPRRMLGQGAVGEMAALMGGCELPWVHVWRPAVLPCVAALLEC